MKKGQKWAKQRKKRERRWSPSTEPWQTKMAQGVLGTVEDAAACIDLPPSFVYTHWKDLPGSRKIGRYIRFNLSQLANSNHFRAGGADE